MARLDLPDGQWIDVKDKLQVRDKRDVHTYSVDGVSSDGKTYRFNVVKHQIATAAVRITGWSLPVEYPNGKRSATADRIAVIEGLDEDTFDAMTTVLDAHAKAADAEADAEKNETPAGVNGAETITPSAGR
jgi:hypothetical protein